MSATDQLAAIEARAKAATAGPWEALTDPGDRKIAPAWIVDADTVEIRMPATYEAGKIATFIAHARTDVPALLALVRELQARLDAADQLTQRLIATPHKSFGSIEQAGFGRGLRAAGRELRAAITPKEGA